MPLTKLKLLRINNITKDKDLKEANFIEDMKLMNRRTYRKKKNADNRFPMLPPVPTIEGSMPLNEDCIQICDDLFQAHKIHVIQSSPNHLVDYGKFQFGDYVVISCRNCFNDIGIARVKNTHKEVDNVSRQIRCPHCLGTAFHRYSLDIILQPNVTGAAFIKEIEKGIKSNKITVVAGEIGLEVFDTEYWRESFV